MGGGRVEWNLECSCSCSSVCKATQIVRCDVPEAMVKGTIYCLGRVLERLRRVSAVVLLYTDVQGDEERRLRIERFRM